MKIMILLAWVANFMVIFSASYSHYSSICANGQQTYRQKDRQRETQKTERQTERQKNVAL